MTLTDEGQTLPAVDISTDDGKNEHAKNVAFYQLARIVRDCRRAILDLNEGIGMAPGGKAAVETKMGGLLTEFSDMVTKITALCNDHSELGAEDMVYTGVRRG